MPTKLDIPKANHGATTGFGIGLGLLATPNTEGPTVSQLLPVPPASSEQVADLESELQEISKELAGSIRREMELEDELDRLRAVCAEQHGGTATHGYSASGDRRTSDYFSDSGTTSSRYGGDDATLARMEELERGKRKAELEKAQFKLEMGEKMAQVLKQRRLAEDRISALEEHVQVQSRNISAATSPTPSPIPTQITHKGGLSAVEALGGTEQQKRWIRNLEVQLEESRRKVVEERTARLNVEELIGGMRYEISAYREERDRLRDEVVPSLEQRVQDLERSGGNSLLSPRPTGRPGSVSFSSTSNARLRKDSLSQESRETLVQRVRDLDGQREALHKALKGLLERHRLVEKNHSRRLRSVQTELDKAMVSQRSIYGIRSVRGSGMVLSAGLLSPQQQAGGSQPLTALINFTDEHGNLSPDGSKGQQGGGSLGWPGIFGYGSKKKTAAEEERVQQQQTQMQVRPLNVPQQPQGLNLLRGTQPTPANSAGGVKPNGVHIGGGIISPVASATSPKPTGSILDPPGMFRKPTAWAL
jgi:hypothetical protein